MCSVGTCVCSGRMWSVCYVCGVCIVYVCNVYVWYMVRAGFVCGMYMWYPCMHSGRIGNVCMMCVMRGCGVCVYDMWCVCVCVMYVYACVVGMLGVGRDVSAIHSFSHYGGLNKILPQPYMLECMAPSW